MKKEKSYSYIEEDLWPLVKPIGKFKLDPKNTRRHDDRSIKEIKRSLEMHGQKKPIVVEKKTKVIRAGNGTLKAAKELGWKHIAAVVSSDPEVELRRYAIRDNRTAELSDWDAEVLVEEIDDLDIDHDELGFLSEELDDIVKNIEEEQPTEDDYNEVTFSAAPDGMTMFKFGAFKGYIPDEIYDSFSKKFEALKTDSDDLQIGDVFKAWLSL